MLRHKTNTAPWRLAPGSPNLCQMSEKKKRPFFFPTAIWILFGASVIIGFVLVLTIAATFIFLGPAGVALERISLGALIIALGMLVDNAIVIVDGMLVRMNNGMGGEEAAREVSGQQATPLLGATAVAIIAFAAIGLSPDSTGEFCSSLFTVIGISLSLSWVTAMTITPLLGIWFLKPPKPSTTKEKKDPYDNAFYNGYKKLLDLCMRFRWVTVMVVTRRSMRLE